MGSQLGREELLAGVMGLVGVISILAACAFGLLVGIVALVRSALRKQRTATTAALASEGMVLDSGLVTVTMAGIRLNHRTTCPMQLALTSRGLVLFSNKEVVRVEPHHFPMLELWLDRGRLHIAPHAFRDSSGVYSHRIEISSAELDATRWVTALRERGAKLR